MHPDLANLACTFVCQTTSLHVTHLHEVVRAQSPIACLGDNTKNNTFFLLNFSSRRAGPNWMTRLYKNTRVIFFTHNFLVGIFGPDTAESHVWNILKLDPEGNIPKYQILIGSFAFIFIRVCESVYSTYEFWRPKERNLHSSWLSWAFNWKVLTNRDWRHHEFKIWELEPAPLQFKHVTWKSTDGKGKII